MNANPHTHTKVILHSFIGNLIKMLSGFIWCWENFVFTSVYVGCISNDVAYEMPWIEFLLSTKRWRDIPKKPIRIHAVGVIFLLNLQTKQYQANTEEKYGK